MPNLHFDQVIYITGLAGVAVFAISGALAAAEKHLDILAFVLFGTLTGIGGGTIRDIILNKPQVFWVLDPSFLMVCFVVSIITYFAANILASLHRSLLWMDAAGMALFSILGTAKALEYSGSWLVAITLGMVTASFGSILRDVILNVEPVLLGPEIYVTASLLGCSTYVLLTATSLNPELIVVISSAVAFALRGAGIIWGLKFPKYGDA